jgi:hypothetical protein
MRKRIIEQMDKGEVKRGSENEPPFADEKILSAFRKKPLKPQAVVVPT